MLFEIPYGYQGTPSLANVHKDGRLNHEGHPRHCQCPILRCRQMNNWKSPPHRGWGQSLGGQFESRKDAVGRVCRASGGAVEEWRRPHTSWSPWCVWVCVRKMITHVIENYAEMSQV